MTSIDLFDYLLPDKLIAQRPADKRDASRMMTLNRVEKTIVHNQFTDFSSYLREGDLLVINSTKVFPARLQGHRKTGGAIEALLTRERADGLWGAMIRGLGKLKIGEIIYFGDGEATLEATHDDGLACLRFKSGKEALRLCQKYGDTPLPPYIRRPGGKADDADDERYQTVFAKSIGSCAAPTAGLHFSNDTLAAVEALGARVARITLHVGPGTFRPVKVANINEHKMDAEAFEVTEETVAMIDETKRNGGRVVAVGSTVTRTLENLSVINGKTQACNGETALFITPGFKFKVVDALLTNFHLPKSTLLMLVSAFAGRELAMEAYAEAVEKEYRFFSYGDAMLIV